jgi:hypothetical protein
MATTDVDVLTLPARDVFTVFTADPYDEKK